MTIFIRIPQANPHKWKKYSLDDADISDRTNASAAFAFLAEMERRKDTDDGQDDASAMDADANDSSRGKILFKKQNHRQKPSFNKSVSVRKQLECTDTASNESSESGEKPMLKGSKVVMPEYVIGQKVSSSKTKKTKLSSSSSKTQTDETKSSKQQNQKPHLQHLFDEEEDEDQNLDDDDDKMDDN